ncbi:hypothetical protein L1987_11654 [Smallanthus sonchifolius]|uniref:Uncharacterized protein n=1 Tax=Smallanthus sonchifolius TaxID=185202 RepID=A0ACB9JDN4_9ASTR|nr:hypothetical protein L1987_11654 [Smallanthus sonchifolius]
MNEAEMKKQTSMVTKSSSIKRKPLADLTNIVRKPNHSSSFVQSKKSGFSTASDSSIGSTQNPVNVLRPIVGPPDQPIPSKPQRFESGNLDGDENQTTKTRSHSSQNTRSNTKAAVPFYQSSFQERRKNVKEGSVSICSSTLDKIKDQEKVNQSCLDKTVNDGKKISVTPHHSSTERIEDKRKSIDVSLSAHHMKSTNNSMDTPIPLSTEKLKDKGKENVVQSSYSFTGNANSNMDITMSDSLMKRKDKGKAIAVPLDCPSRKMLKNNMMEFGVPLKGVIIKERDGTSTGSGSVKLAQKDKGKGVSTPVIYHTLKKKDQQSSCPPILRTMSNRSLSFSVCQNDAGVIEDVLQSKLKTEPPPNKKKRRCSTKEAKEVYTLPQDYVEQQRAYFKEIDDFELQVEEV